MKDNEDETAKNNKTRKEGTNHMKEDQQQDKRRSKRLKKEVTLTTKEKNNIMTKKRNIEGNNYPTSNYISVLSTEDLINRIGSMIIITNDDVFEKIELLKDLQFARHILDNGKKEGITTPHTLQECELIQLNNLSLLKNESKRNHLCQMILS